MHERAGDRIEFANTLRGIAAFLVLIAHYLGVFWGGHSAASALVGAPPIIGLEGVMLVPDISPLNWGYLGVSLFFLISGFVIPFSFERYSVRGFLVGRALRIYPTYFAGFAVSLLSIIATTQYFGTPFPHSLGDVLLHIPGLRELARVPSIDGIIWTLDVEIKFYVACAMIAPWLRRGSLLVFLVPAAIFVVVMATVPVLSQWIPSSRLYAMIHAQAMTGQYVVFMFIGVALHFAFRRVHGLVAMTSIAVALFCAMTCLWTFGVRPNVTHIAWSYGLASIVFMASMALAQHFKRNSVSGFFADISYPLYVSHPIFGYALLRVTVGAGMPPWVCVTVTTAAAIALAYAIHVLVERPSQMLGRRLAQGVLMRRPRRLSSHQSTNPA
jgi:peptidoglycan/LPS O-acetylase OafA/YrhL